MSDLVGRLRHVASFDNGMNFHRAVMAEAADEIERLLGERLMLEIPIPLGLAVETVRRSGPPADDAAAYGWYECLRTIYARAGAPLAEVYPQRPTGQIGA